MTANSGGNMSRKTFNILRGVTVQGVFCKSFTFINVVSNFY
jgi:hypothetical protein